MKNSVKKMSVIDRAFRDARKDFMRDKDDFGVVTTNDVAMIGLVLVIAAVMVTLVSGKSDADVLFAGGLAILGLTAVILSNSGEEPGDDDTV